MTGFLISAFIVSVLVVITWLLIRIMDGDRLAAVGLCFIIFIVIGLVFNFATKSESRGPCHEYKTQMMYNAATKTMMPSRVCVLQGEWISNEKETSHD